MPSIYLNLPKSESAKRDALVETTYAAAASVLKGMHIHTFVNEYDVMYCDGKPEANSTMTVITLEAGPMPVDKIEIIGSKMAEGVKAVMGDAQETTLVYHANGLDHLVINGKLIKR